MSSLELGVDAVKALEPAAQAAERLAQEALESGVARSDSVGAFASRLHALGDFTQATKLADDGVAGMSQEEFIGRMNSGHYFGTPVRVKQFDDTTGYLVAPELMNDRKLGAVGTLDSYIPGHGDVFGVTQADGTVAPYRAATELEPAVLKPDAVKDLPVVSREPTAQIADLSQGDVLKTIGVPSAKVEGGEPWVGYASTDSVAHPGSGPILPGRQLLAADGIKVVGKEINPTEAQVGDELELTGNNFLEQGRFRVTDVQGLVHGKSMMFGRFNVEGADGEDLLLRNSHDLQGTALPDGKLFRVPRAEVTNGNYFKMRPLDPQPGDVLAVPQNAPVENAYDLDLRMMRGRTWNVEQAAENGVVVRNGKDVYALPKRYLTEPMVYDLDSYLKNGS